MTIRTPEQLLDAYWRESTRPRPVYVVRDADAHDPRRIVDWSTSRAAALWSPKASSPVVERVTAPADPAAPRRALQLVELRAAAPKRSDHKLAGVPAQHDASALPLFVAANEPTLL